MPSWIEDELKAGIPVDASADASNEDSSDTDDQSTAIKLVTKTTAKRELSNQSERVSIIRRTSNQSILRHRELRNKIISNTSSPVNETTIAETTIVDGVAITTNPALTTSTIVSSPHSTSRSSSVTEIEMSPPPVRTTSIAADEENADKVGGLIVQAGFHFCEFGPAIARPALWAFLVRFSDEDSLRRVHCRAEMLHCLGILRLGTFKLLLSHKLFNSFSPTFCLPLEDYVSLNPVCSEFLQSFQCYFS